MLTDSAYKALGNAWYLANRLMSHSLCVSVNHAPIGEKAFHSLLVCLLHT